ncbi:hypothetical protein CALVIDRAFT_600813 [Calocera viscosa TUFC12733]|uniref:Arrestin-like N-terminal domain-containing protein n=1 Tax=Calocera viscosa (strain TUFC12733) TaxID=1330018 RepID=A0A167J9G2_CALVF|nr:hypothetical protein CALVIDRAFT_600813 [Calocera viscosa TUFC12733]
MSPREQRPALDEHIATRLLHERVLYRKGRAVLALNFRSSETSTNGQPVFYNEDIIEGTVQLLGSKNVERVTFQGKGFVVTPDVGAENVFWSSEEVLYTSLASASLFQRLIGKHFKALTGSHSWRFSLRLPSQVTVRTKKGMRYYPLPPSYRREFSTGELGYQLAISAYRGPFRETYNLAVPFIYVPRCTPEYPLWRITSEQTGTTQAEEGYVDISPTGPRNIPAGSFSTVEDDELPYVVRQQSIQGTVFGNRRVLVTLRALYNNPPIFAPDAHIRVSVTLESDDSQVLDLLASESCLQAHLEQRAIFSRGQDYADTLSRASLIGERSPNIGPMRHRVLIQRKVELCLECPQGVCPTFSFPGLTLQHFIVIQISASGFFVPTIKQIPPLRLAIQIVTDSNLP